MSTVSDLLCETLPPMNSVELGRQLEKLRTDHTPEYPRQLLGERLGYRGQSAYQLIWAWEAGKREIPAVAIPTIAETLGVTICDIYGIDCKKKTTGSQLQLAERAARIVNAELGDLESLEQELLAEIKESLARYRAKLESLADLPPSP